MEKISERPICHRAEDLVTYLYGEATAEEARDFGLHIQQCDACRAEFNLFNQVHESIVAWRSEVLGPVPVRETGVINIAAPVATSTTSVHRPRKLSGLATLREFFIVSPIWLRGAAAFAGVLLCVLIAIVVLRLGHKPAPIANPGSEANYRQQDFDKAVQVEVDKRMAQVAQQQPENTPRVATTENIKKRGTQIADNRVRSNNRRTRLTSDEREQLAADLGLIQARDEELPFVLPDQPNP